MRATRLTTAAVAIAIGAVGATAAAAATPDVGRLAQAVRRAAIDDALGTSPESRRATLGQARAIADRLSVDGTWPDVDYANPARGSWPSIKHCERVLLLAAAAEGAESSADHDRLAAAAERSLGWWRAHDPKCLNWWYNEIGVPAQIGRAAIVLGPRLTSADRAYVTGTVLPRAQKQKMTGTNTVSLTGNILLLALLNRDEALASSCLKTLFGRATVTTAEGIQPDFSFHQHGPQQQLGNYGQELFVKLSRLAATTTPAGWPLTDDQAAALRHFGFDGLQWTLWHGVMDVSACGRQLFPHSGSDKGREVAHGLELFAQVSPGDRPAVDAALRRELPDAPNDLVGDRYFWRSDYGVHRRPGFMATLRMCSPRAIGGESLNSENLAGYYMGTGATFFYRTGIEYQDAWPLYDWRKIPGVTCPWSAGPMPKFSAIKNGSGFVGAATDGTNTAAAFDLDRYGVSASKAYFFLGDNVVCLGAGVSAKSDDPIVTTVDQFQVPDGDRTEWPKSARQVEDRGLRYELLSPGSLSSERGERSGAWSVEFRNGAMPSGTVRGTMATVWIDHGKRPADASYAYRVCLADGALPVKVLSNATALQAVEADGIVAAVLREAGVVSAGGQDVRVDQPCALLADPAKGLVTVADPTQKLAAVHVMVGGETVAAELPTGGMAGSSVTVAVKGLAK